MPTASHAIATATTTLRVPVMGGDRETLELGQEGDEALFGTITFHGFATFAALRAALDEPGCWLLWVEPNDPNTPYAEHALLLGEEELVTEWEEDQTEEAMARSQHRMTSAGFVWYGEDDLT